MLQTQQCLVFSCLYRSIVVGLTCRNSAGICPQRAVHSGWREAFKHGAREDERSAAAHLEQRSVASCKAEWGAFLDMFCVASVPEPFRACWMHSTV